MPASFALNGSPLSICFDLDGTLIDTAPDLIRVLNEITAPEGVNPVSVDEARQLVGSGSMALIQYAFQQSGITLPDDHANQLRARYLDVYAESLAQLSLPFVGVTEVLAQLKRGGARLSICTNKPGYMARSLLDQLKLSALFDTVVGSGDGVACKPAAQHIFTAVGHRGANPIIMVGDGAPDVQAARAAKIPIVLMSYGYCPVSMHSFGADAVLRSIRELPSALKFILKSS